MTEPTQAQIEAADLIDRLARLAKEPHLKHLPLAEAAAALTTAAEVGHSETHWGFTMTRPHSPEWHIIRATIERCAKVALQWQTRQGLAIAEAIRALKEKP